MNRSSIILLTLLLAPEFTMPMFSQDNSGRPAPVVQEIVNVSFCGLAKNPKIYFDNTVRITATFQQADEGQYLDDEQCDKKERLGVGHAVTTPEQVALRNKILSSIGSPEYGSRAVVTVVGTLRDIALHGFVWYDHRFDIIRFEQVAPVIVTYRGSLEDGVTYRARVMYDRDEGVFPLIPLKIPLHQAARIEWTNLKKFPGLVRLLRSSKQWEIVFRVTSSNTVRMTRDRWDRTFRCLILSVK
jgi:hypothetical protein